MWAALAGSLVFWGLRLFARPAPVPAQVQTVAIDQAVRGDVLRLLGAVAQPGAASAPPPPAAAARFKLVGAVASTGAGPSWAVLSVDDQPPRVVRLGASVDGQWVLQDVTAKGVSLGPAGAASQLTLELPQLPPPATGTLPGVAMGGGGAVQAGAVLPGQTRLPVPAQMQPQFQPQTPPQMQPPLQPEPASEQMGTVTGGVVDPNQAR